MTTTRLGHVDANAGPAPPDPAFLVRHELKNPAVAITVLPGDLLDQETHLAIGFCDTFDTCVTDDRIINGASIQGQLLQRLYGGDQAHLDEQLTTALAAIAPATTESRADKSHGKLDRYPLGTVAVLGEPRRLIFAVAYGQMGNDLIVRAPVGTLWHCYTQLWDATYRHGQLAALSVPLMGTGLARVDTLDHNNLLQLILLSFTAYTRFQLICRELRIVIHPDEVARIDLASLRAFLGTL